jgi:FAD/FMN-containing dehydrogenase
VSRAFGLTCDSLQAVDIVTADGDLHHCSAKENSDLFWALRGGGGGSFGVVTNLTYALHDAPPDVTTFSVEWQWSEAASGLAEWMAWVPTLPAQTTTIARLETTPVLVVAGVHLGTRDETRQLLAPLYSGVPTIQRSATARSYGDAMLLEESCLHNRSDQCAPAPSTGASPILGTRQPFVATSAYFEHPLPVSAINAAIEAMNNHLPTAGSGTGTIQFDSYGGAIAEVAPTATAFAHRNAFCSAQYASFWTTPGSTDPHRAWLRATRATLNPWSDGGAYVNYADPELQGWAHAYWGNNLPQLQKVKQKWDPQNLFSFAQSVPLP